MSSISHRRLLRERPKGPPWIVLLPIITLFMFHWWGPGLPISPRGESVPQLSYIWMLRRLWASGDALRGWNPLVLSGEPTATARVYHLHLSLAAFSSASGLSPEWVLKLVQWGATLLAGLGMYDYVRQIKGSRGAALVAATLFALFPARVMLTVESLFVTCAWAGLPWAFSTYERMRRSQGSPLRPAIIWALPLAWIALTGTQWLLLLFTPLALYVILREGCAWLNDTQRARQTWSIKRMLLTTSITAVSLIALTLFYYLPSLLEKDLLWSAHYFQAYPATSRWSVPWSLLLKILVRRWTPGFDPLGWDLARIFPNATWYLGWVACVLALLGAARLRKWPHTVPLLGILLVSMLLVAGPSIAHNPAYFIVRRIPYILDSVRNSFRYFWPASFALAALAGLGVDLLVPPRSKAAWHWLVSLAIVSLVIVDFWPLTQAYGICDGYLNDDQIAIHRWLDEAKGSERYWAPFQLKRPGQHYADTSYGIRYDERASVNDDEYHTPSAPYRATLMYGQALRGEVEASEGLSPTAQAILDLANVRYMTVQLWPDVYKETVTGLIDTGRWRVISDTEQVDLLENLTTRPYVHTYDAGIPFKGTDDALLHILPQALARGYALVEQPGQAFEPALVENSLRFLDESGLQATSSIPNTQGQFAVARLKSDEIWVQFRAQAPFLMMVSETWYPHWQVTVNGEECPLLRLNGNYLGVYVQQSTGHAIFRYRHPWYVWLGYAISLTTAIAAIVYLSRRQPIRLRPDAE